MEEKLIIKLTQEELQLIYSACMSYGDKLLEIKKSIPDEGKDILDSLADREKESRKLARNPIYKIACLCGLV